MGWFSGLRDALSRSRQPVLALWHPNQLSLGGLTHTQQRHQALGETKERAVHD